MQRTAKLDEHGQRGGLKDNVTQATNTAAFMH